MTASSRFLTNKQRGARVQAAIAATGMTEWTWCKKHGIHYASLRRWIDGKRSDPPVSTIIALAEALGVSAGFLIDRREVK